MKPLSQKTRNIFLFILVIIFFIIAPIIIVNSLGYKIDKDDIKDVFMVVKTGGIYINSDISTAEIYIDGEYYKNSGLFIKNTLIQDLNPEQKYEILFKKDGRHDWRKEISVFESLVTEARVLMLEKEINKNIVYPFFDEFGNGTTTATDIIVIGDQEIKTETFLKDDTKKKDLSEDSLIGGEIPSNPDYRNLINLFFDGELYSKVTEDKFLLVNSTSTIIEKDIPEYFIELGISDPESLKNLIEEGGEVSWIENGNIILNWVNGDSIPYYYCLGPDDCRDQIILDWSEDIKRFDFLPGRNDVFVVLVSDGIYAVEVDDRSQRNIQPLYLQSLESKDVGYELNFRKNNRNQIIVKDGILFYELQL